MDQDVRKCEHAGCESAAIMAVRTGSRGEPFQVDHVCDDHAKEDWERISPVVAAGIMHYTVLPVGSFDLQTGEIVVGAFPANALPPESA